MVKENKEKTRLDDLLDKTEPYATFHDAMLHTITIDYDTKEFTARVDLCVGNPDAKTEIERERRRIGVLKASGMIFWALEPPDNEDRERWGPLWLTDDGLIKEAPTKTAKKLISTLVPDTYGWYLYFADINAFGYLLAKGAVFKWERT